MNAIRVEAAQGKGSPIWVVFGKAKIKRRIPVCAALSLRITNLQQVATTIEGIGADVRSRTNEWATMTLIPTTAENEVAFNNGMALSDENQFLDGMLLSKRLEPGLPVSGWLMFEYPSGVTVDPQSAKFRVTISDAMGAVVKSPDLAAEKGPVPSLQGGVFLKIGQHMIDLAALPIQFMTP